MAIFSGKIIEAYFANSENNTVEVIYEDGKRAINHYLPVDYNNQDFKDNGKPALLPERVDKAPKDHSEPLLVRPKEAT